MKFVATQNSPVEAARLAGPRGDGKWHGFNYVYTAISTACQKIAQTNLHLSDEHVNAMAALGSGHEDRMKSMLWYLRDRGLV